MRNHTGGSNTQVGMGGRSARCCKCGENSTGARVGVPPSTRAVRRQGSCRVLHRQRLMQGSESLVETNAGSLSCHRSTCFHVDMEDHSAVHDSSSCNTTKGYTTSVRGVKGSTDVYKTDNEGNRKGQKAILSLKQRPSHENVQKAKPTGLTASQPSVLLLKRGDAARRIIRCAGGGSAPAPPGDDDVKTVTVRKSWTFPSRSKGRHHGGSTGGGRWNDLETSASPVQKKDSQGTRIDCARNMCSKLSKDNDTVPTGSNAAISRMLRQANCRPADCVCSSGKSILSPTDAPGNKDSALSTTTRMASEPSERLGGMPATVQNEDVLEEQRIAGQHTVSGTFQCTQLMRTTLASSLRTTHEIEYPDAHNKSGSAEKVQFEEGCNRSSPDTNVVMDSPRSRRAAVLVANVNKPSEEVSSRRSSGRISSSTQTQDLYYQTTEKMDNNGNAEDATRGENAGGVLHALQSMIEQVNTLQQSLALKDAIIYILLQRCVDQEECTRRMLLAVFAQLLEQRESLDQQEQQLQRAEADIRDLKAVAACSSTVDFSDQGSLHCSRPLPWFTGRSSTSCSVGDYTNTVSTVHGKRVGSVDCTSSSRQDLCTQDFTSVCSRQTPSSYAPRQVAMADALVAWEYEEESQTPTAALHRPTTTHTTQFTPLSELEKSEPDHTRVEDVETVPVPSTPSLLPLPADTSSRCTFLQDDWLFTTEDSKSSSHASEMLLKTPLRRHLSPSHDHDVQVELQSAGLGVWGRSASLFKVVETSGTLIFSDGIHDGSALEGPVQELPSQQGYFTRASSPPAPLDELAQCVQSSAALSEVCARRRPMVRKSFSSFGSVMGQSLHKVATRVRIACKGASNTWCRVALTAVAGAGCLISGCAPPQHRMCFSPYCPACCIPPGSPSSPFFLMRQNPFFFPHTLSSRAVAAVGLFHPSCQ